MQVSATLPSRRTLNAVELYRSARYVVESYPGGISCQIRRLDAGLGRANYAFMQEEEAATFLQALDRAIDDFVDTRYIDSWLAEYNSVLRQAA